MKVLITGAAGFIGSHLADALVRRGAEVVGIDDLSTGVRENFPHEDAVLVVGDIRDMVPRDDWDLVIHCAASYHDRSDWERDASTNVEGTINVIREAMRTDARLAYFQTSLCYGPRPKSPVPVDAELRPEGSYAISKVAGENYIRDSGVEWTSMRLANIYGPRNLSGPPATFFKRLSEGSPVTVVDSRRDFVYIDDLVDIAIQIALKGEGVYHVSSGRDISILDLFHAVRRAMNIEGEEPGLTPRGPDDAASILIDPSVTEREFQWHASTSLNDGIRKAVAWYQQHGVAKTFTHLKG